MGALELNPQPPPLMKIIRGASRNRDALHTRVYRQSTPVRPLRTPPIERNATATQDRTGAPRSVGRGVGGLEDGKGVRRNTRTPGVRGRNALKRVVGRLSEEGVLFFVDGFSGRYRASQSDPGCLGDFLWCGDLSGAFPLGERKQRATWALFFFRHLSLVFF